MGVKYPILKFFRWKTDDLLLVFGHHTFSFMIYSTGIGNSTWVDRGKQSVSCEHAGAHHWLVFWGPQSLSAQLRCSLTPTASDQKTNSVCVFSDGSVKSSFSLSVFPVSWKWEESVLRYQSLSQGCPGCYSHTHAHTHTIHPSNHVDSGPCMSNKETMCWTAQFSTNVWL